MYQGNVNTYPKLTMDYGRRKQEAIDSVSNMPLAHTTNAIDINLPTKNKSITGLVESFNKKGTQQLYGHIKMTTEEKGTNE